MTVRVTQEHIDESVRSLGGGVYRCANCPVALALSETFGIPVAVDGQYAYLTTEDGQEELYMARLPKHVGAWVCDFDRSDCDPEARQRVRPFSFRIRKITDWAPFKEED